MRVPALRPDFAENRLFRRFFCVLSSVFAVSTIAVLWWFLWRNSGQGMSESSRRNRPIPNPSLTPCHCRFDNQSHEFQTRTQLCPVVHSCFIRLFDYSIIVWQIPTVLTMNTWCARNLIAPSSFAHFFIKPP